MEQKKPLIGLTSSHNVDTDEVSLTPYCPRAILAAGGIPVILPLEASLDDLLQLVLTMDGFLFTGGPDVHPFFFGEETRMGCGKASLKRDRMELALLKLAMEQRKPIMGICRGIQLINIGLGGTIYQDIPSQAERVYPIAHSQPFPHRIPSHTVKITAGSKLEAILSGNFPGGKSLPAGTRSCISGPDGIVGGVPGRVSDSDGIPGFYPPEEPDSAHSLIISVNSTHHQAVLTPAPCLTACAYAPDGIIEGVVMEEYPYLVGVQWHPEYLWEEDPAAMNLFKALIQAAS